MEIPRNANITGGEPILSDAYTINGKPGHLYPCSKSGISELIRKSIYIDSLNKEITIKFELLNDKYIYVYVT